MTQTLAAPRGRSPAKESLRANVVFRRAQAGFSQSALAERSGVSRPTISRIERGEASDVTLDTIERLADALGTTVADLLIHHGDARVGEREMRRRAHAGPDEFVDADTFLEALEEASPARYSNAGRPRMAR